MLILKDANCGNLADWAKRQGYWHPYTETPQPADLVLFDFRKNHTKRDHIGIVESASGSTVTTIEGNTGSTNDANGGAVMERARDISVITGYIRLPLTAAQRAKLVEIARAQIGVTEWPADSNRVKYNTWFYGSEVSGSAYPWCAAFVCWCVAMLTGEATDSATQTGTAATYIKGFQSWLNTSYAAGLTVDGRAGPLTRRAACRALQTYLNAAYAAGLAVDGAYGPKTKAALRGHETKRGDRGDMVRILQGLLYAAGYDTKGVDGIFGAATDSAVRALQKARKLTVDGEAGGDTFGALFAG